MCTTVGQANSRFIASTAWMFCALFIAITIIDFGGSLAFRIGGEIISWIE
jgi:hypothetical protein